MESVSIILCALGGLGVLWLLWKPRQRKGRAIPGPTGLPIAGYAFRIYPKTFHLDMMEMAKKHGEIVAVEVYGKKLIILNSERMIRKAFTGENKEVMNDRPPLFVKKHFFPEESISFSSKGFSPRHTALRKAFTNGFTANGDGVEEFESAVRSEIKALLDYIEDFHGEEFDFTDVIRNSVGSLMSVFMCGKGLSAGDKNLANIWEYIQAINRLATPKVNTVMTALPFVRYLPGTFKTLYHQFEDSLQMLTDTFFYRYKMKDESTSINGMIGFFLSEQRRQQSTGEDVVLTDGRIIGFISDILTAGASALYGSLASTFLCLMRHPEVCRRMQAEILKVVGKDRLPELDDKARCPYTEAVFLEVQRYITLVPMGGPHACRENVSLEGYDVPAGSVLMANQWYMHHDETVWGDPWTFRPERFLDDAGQLLPRTHVLLKSWMPFGTGNRKCAGDVFARSRIFLFVTSLLQKWTFIPSDDKCGSCDPRSDQFEAAFGLLPRSFSCRVVENKAPDECE